MNSRFTEIGRIGRPRGLDGVVRFISHDIFDADLLNTLNIVYIRNERSDLVPLRIKNVYKEVKKNQPVFFVQFDMIANREDADQAMDKAVFTDKELHPDGDNSPHKEEITGYGVFYEGKQIGTVLDKLQNPAHPILEIKEGSGTLLIPMVDEFIDNIDHEKREVRCINLDQLMEE